MLCCMISLMKKAIINNNFLTVKDIVSCYYNMDIHDHESILQNWLTEAITYERVDIVKYFLQFGIKISYPNLNLHHYRFLISNPEILQEMLLTNPYIPQLQEWFQTACFYGYTISVKILADKLDAKSLFKLAVTANASLEILEIVRQISEPDLAAYQLAMTDAASFDNVEMLKYLQALGAKITQTIVDVALQDANNVLSYLINGNHIDVTEYQNQMLRSAIYYNNATAARLVLQHGSIDVDYIRTEAIDNNGWNIFVVLAEYLVPQSTLDAFIRQILSLETCHGVKRSICQILAKTSFQAQEIDIPNIYRWSSRKIWALVVTRITDIHTCQFFIKRVLIKNPIPKIKNYLLSFLNLISGLALKSMAANVYWQHYTKPDWHSLPENVKMWLLSAALESTKILSY